MCRPSRSAGIPTSIPQRVHPGNEHCTLCLSAGGPHPPGKRADVPVSKLCAAAPGQPHSRASGQPGVDEAAERPAHVVLPGEQRQMRAASNTQHVCQLCAQDLRRHARVQSVSCAHAHHGQLPLKTQHLMAAAQAAVVVAESGMSRHALPGNTQHVCQLCTRDVYCHARIQGVGCAHAPHGQLPLRAQHLMDIAWAALMAAGRVPDRRAPKMMWLCNQATC